jgi:hypothetical protein
MEFDLPCYTVHRLANGYWIIRALTGDPFFRPEQHGEGSLHRTIAACQRPFLNTAIGTGNIAAYGQAALRWLPRGGRGAMVARRRASLKVLRSRGVQQNVSPPTPSVVPSRHSDRVEHFNGASFSQFKAQAQNSPSCL